MRHAFGRVQRVFYCGREVDLDVYMFDVFP